mmetsp:Transcript_1919/g.5444  ORF Transcript_1919/g.5444 Transcript_1919/m.5444 type:complete len:224 (+) Transcript_1919:2562-3233(+)
MMMLMMKAQRPAAALDFFIMASYVNWSPRAIWIFLAFSILAWGTFPSSIWNLYSFRFCRNFSGLPIIFTAAFQEPSFRAPFLSTSMFGSMPACRCIAASQTSPTPPGGAVKVFRTWNSFLSRMSRAASASLTSGTALARSSSQEACCWDTSLAILAQSLSSTPAFSDSACTLAFSLPTSSANMSAAWAFSATTTAFTFSSSSRPATSDCVLRNFSRPLVRRSF